MTTFTTIPNASLEPGKPIRSIDGLALRDNPIAMFEGDASAPRIIGRAAKRFIDYPVLTVAASNAVNVELGSNFESLTLETTNTANPPTVVAYRYTISSYTGSIRFKASHRATDVGFTARLSIYKNGSLIQAYTNQDNIFIQRTNDVSVAVGDVIEWRHSCTAGNTSYVSGGSATASDGYVPRLLYIANSEINRA